MHALPVNLPCVKQLPVITNEAGASPHAGSTCAIGVVTVRPFNRQPAQLYFKLTPDPNNTFFFIFTCTTQYPWVLANPDLSQAMASSKQKRTHTVFRASSTHRSASTSKPRFAGERVKLGDVCTIVSGATPKTKTNEYWGGEIRWVTPAELDGDSHYISDTEKHLTEAGYKSTSLRMMPKGTVLLTTRAPIGKVAIAAEEMSCNQGFKNLVCSSAINNEFLYLYLKSRTAELQAMGRGATFKELSKKNVAGFEINLPAIDRQLDAVAKLTAVRSQIALAKQQHDQLDSLVKSRFVEMFGSSSADSRYEVCRIGDIADVFVGVVIKPKQYYTDDHANGIKAFRSLNVGEMQVRDDDWVYFSKEGNKKAKKTQLHAGDVLVVRSGYPGTSCVVPLLYEGCNAVDLIIARSNSNNVLPEYIAAFNNGSHMKSLINQMSVGSAQKHFNIGFYRNVEIPLPPLSAQKEYVSFLRQVDKSRFVRDHEINFR